MFRLQPAALAFLTRSPRTDLVVSYEPDIELFRTMGRFNSWNHWAEGHFEHKIGRRWGFLAEGSFLDTRDPSFQFERAIYLPRGEFREGSVYGGKEGEGRFGGGDRPLPWSFPK